MWDVSLFPLAKHKLNKIFQHLKKFVSARVPACVPARVRVSLTREQQPQFSSHVLWDSFEHQFLGLLRAVHAHALPVLRKVILPGLLLQKLLRLSTQH